MRRWLFKWRIWTWLWSFVHTISIGLHFCLRYFFNENEMTHIKVNCFSLIRWETHIFSKKKKWVWRCPNKAKEGYRDNAAIIRSNKFQSERKYVLFLLSANHLPLILTKNSPSQQPSVFFLLNSNNLISHNACSYWCNLHISYHVNQNETREIIFIEPQRNLLHSGFVNC